MRSPRYWARRLVVILASADNRACRLRDCPEPTVGFSVWCRKHTDQIRHHDHDPDLAAALALHVPAERPGRASALIVGLTVTAAAILFLAWTVA